MRGLSPFLVCGWLVANSALQAQVTGNRAPTAGGATPTPAPTAPAGNPAPAPDRIVILGSNIRSTDLEAVSPRTLLDEEAIRRTGTTSLGELFRLFPQNNAGAFTENQNDSLAPGGAAVSLRGLGPDATLVLVNGRRVAPYPFAQNGVAAFVDLNSLPLAAIERIEVLRDGASAIYGTDAIAGVVNVGLRQGFQGTEVETGYGNTTDTDTGEYRLALVAGLNDARRGFEGVFVADYFKRNALFQGDRYFSESIDQRRQGGSSFLSSSGDPGSVFDPITGNPLGVPANSDGTPTVAEFRRGFNRFDRAPFQPLVPETERYGFYGRASLRLAPSLDAFAEAGYRASFTRQSLAPTPIEGDVENIAVPAANPFNPFGQDVFFRYRVTEAGAREDQISADTYRFVGGLKARLPGRWETETALLFSESRVEDETFNNLSRQAVVDALAQTDPLTAFNVFGAGNNVNNPATINALRVQTTRDGKSSLLGADLKADGPVFKLPAGDLAAAFGVEYRDEDLQDQFDDLVSAGGVIDVNATSASGGRDVFSGYGEILIPVFSPDFAAPGFTSLEIQAAFRAENSSDFGATVKPKVAVAWRPVKDWVLLRGSYGQGFRAPSLVQLFTGAVTFSQELGDAARFASTGADEDASSPLQVIAGGNPDLEPEESENFSAGFVLTPPIVPGLSLALDFFRIEVEGAIATLDPQFILDNEGDFPGFVQRAPPTEADRALGVPGRVLLVNSRFQNLGRVVVDGFDAEAAYESPRTSWGTFGLRASGAYLNSFEQKASPNEPNRELVDSYTRPEFRGRFETAWRLGGFEAVAAVNYTDSFDDARNERVVQSSTTVDAQVSYRFGLRTLPPVGEAGKATIVDPKRAPSPGKGAPAVAITPTATVDRRLFDGLAMTAGVRNLFDEEPPFANNVAGYAVPFDDPRQRFVYVNMRKKF